MPQKKYDPAKKKAKKVVKAKKRVAKGVKLGDKSVSKQLSPKRKKQVKGQAMANTASNLIKSGKKIVKSGGQGKLVKKSTLKVTPRSIRKTDEQKDKYLKAQRKGAGIATTKRKKR